MSSSRPRDEPVTTHLPAVKELRDLLGDLLGRDVSMSPSAPLAPSPGNTATIGVYVDDSLQVRALVALDLALSAHAAAAIGLVPVSEAESAIAERTLDETLRDNLGEVLNIAASLFNVPDAPHVKLYAVHHAGDPVPHDIHARALTLGRREDLAVTMVGYGGGRLAVILV
ncbi:hypothetical protein [Nocardioides sp.]|uniref:hypothetical protein n=1 Tax=Nocardioides sp. TaxID=35761 RepID=UPI0027340367|nr:hypothetical protein [Nocardioides sp.]MDP3890237.1 hypothetical protein [Nocardioides sp.]